MIFDNRKSRKGFTLIELMVVIFIIGILSAVAIPYMRGRTDAAKWTEGKAAAGSIRTAIRALIAEKGNDYDFASNITTLADLGFAADDLDGKYFLEKDYTFTIVNGGGPVQPTFIVTVGPSTAVEGPTAPASMTLTGTGTFNSL